MRTHSLTTAWNYVLSTTAAVAAAGGLLIGQQGVVETASSSPDPSSGAYFDQHIQPILATRCLACHDTESKVSKLDLTTRARALRGGDKGPAFVPGDPQSSLLLKVIKHETQPFMPVGADPLPKNEIDRITAWIASGAPYSEAVVEISDEAGRRRAAGKKLFAEHVKPLFETTCLKCHSTETKASGLDLSNRASMLDGGENGVAVEPGDAKASRLYKAIAHEIEPHMPFRSPRLEQETIDRVAEWINAGAPIDGTLKATSGAIGTSHWAFQKPKRPALPEVASQAWVRNEIDAFVAAEREERDLEPVPAADKRVLLRRVYLDLTGLPPTQEEMDAFLADNSDNAYERIVDKLLEGSRYGERWGRHWMDIWRYSDWYGWRKQNQVRYSHRHVWRWRDWIIESVNKDKGYDRMVMEMFAGDELAPDDPDTVRATGYLARSWYMFNRNVWLQETVEYAGTSFLGLTVKCARCHDHKYDPILQTDYYRLRAFFEPHKIRMDRVTGEPDIEKNGLSRAYDADAGAQTYRFIRGNDMSPDESHPLSPGVPRLFGDPELNIEPIELPLEVSYPASRSFVHSDLIEKAKDDIEKAETEVVEAKKELAEAKRRLTAAGPAEPVLVADGNRAGDEKDQAEETVLTEEEALVALRQAENRAALADKRLLAARAHLPALEARIVADKAKHGLTSDADAEVLAEAALKEERKARILKAEADVLEAKQELTEALLNPNPKPKEGEEEAAKKETEKKKDEKKFADEKRVAEAKKKLQAAVESLNGPTETYTAVGESYPQTSTGRRLALARWIANKDNPLTARVALNHMWLRHFGEGIVPTMFNFGSSGQPPSHPELLDWLAVEFMESGWSMKHMHRLMVTSNTYRMQSLAPRDHPGRSRDQDNIYLWRMNPRRMESEAVRDSLLYLAGQLDPAMGGPEIDATEGEELLRRSVYFQHTPDTQVTFLKLWDSPSPNECFRRNESITPHQALALSNSKVSLSMSRTLAGVLTDRVGEAKSADGRFVDQAFDAILGRGPSNDERKESQKFLVAQAGLYSSGADLKSFDTGAKNEKVPPSSDPYLRARESFVHVLFNHNEFVTIR